MIKVLPGNIANLIAAGEVVQRPSSVVKELIENSLDAFATQITLVVNDSGRTLIQVIDNGVGMTSEEAELCFLRHATSKIATAEDLYKIKTYGFRGEALASIAACADITLKTRREGDETGTEVHIAENQILSSSQTSAPKGTNIAVRNIFYNIPARRKFLKSDNVEYRQIVSEFLRTAIPNPQVEFRFIHNSKEIFHFLPVQNIKMRIVQSASKDLSNDLIDLETDTTVVKIRGFIGAPQNAKKSQTNQYLFVNGRYFRSQLFHKAVMKAYSNLIPEGTQPSYFIFLDIETENIDVNIHPTKTEIKFENDSIIFEILHAAVKEAIGGNSFLPSIDFDMEGVPEIPVAPRNFENIRAPKIDFDPLFNPFRDLDNGAEAFEFGKEYEQKSYTGLFSDYTPAERPLIQIKKRFILTPVKSGLMIIDIKRATERILYTNYLNSLIEAKPAIQENLFPQTLDLDHNDYATLMDAKEQLNSLGFDIRPFGKDCIVIYGVPAALKGEQIEVKVCIESLIADLQEPAGKDFDSEYRKRIAGNVVKSVRYSSKEYSSTEAQSVIDRLFACPDYATSPSGLPCVKIIAAEEIAALLG